VQLQLSVLHRAIAINRFYQSYGLKWTHAAELRGKQHCRVRRLAGGDASTIVFALPRTTHNVLLPAKVEHLMPGLRMIADREMLNRTSKRLHDV
jgi:hypothetical protein